MTIKVLSWNIWQGKHLNEVINFLKTTDADIIGLQEVAEKDSTNTAEEIAQKLGYFWVYYQAIQKTRLGYPQGNAILSKYPIKAGKCYFLSDLSIYVNTAESEPRIAVEATVDINGELIKVFTVHLAYSHKFGQSTIRDSQVENLIKLIPRQKTILLGDFNSYSSSPCIKKLNQILINADKDPTQPTWTMYPFDYEGFQETELKHRLDYIFISGDFKVLDFNVGQSKGSDHLPIIASLEI